MPDTFVKTIPITKVDEVKREVWGTACVEEVDKGDEVMHYASSKPHFLKWSEEAFKRTGGKSRGNVRAMHQPIAAGIVIDFQADDATKSFPIGTYIVDDQEWEKCVKGVYSAFSIGGKYGKRWVGRVAEKSVMFYEALPNEISLVDSPAVPHATFTMIKADGTTEQRAFSASTEQHEFATPLPPDELVPAPVSAEIAKANDLSDDLSVDISGKFSFRDLVHVIVEKITGAATPSPVPVKFPSPNPRRVEDVTVNQFPAVTNPTALVGVANLQAQHPASYEVSLPGTTITKDNITNTMTVTGTGTATFITGTAPSPDAVLVLSKAEAKCPSCGETIGVEKAGDGNCGKCGKGYVAAPDETGAYKLSPAVTSAQPESVPETTKWDTAAWVQTIGISEKDWMGKVADPPADRLEYGDPVNQGSPCNTKFNAYMSIEKYNAGKGRELYSPREWAILGRRIRKLASTVFDLAYLYNPREKQIEREF